MSINLQFFSQPGEAFFSWQGARDLEDTMKQVAKKVNKNRKEDYQVGVTTQGKAVTSNGVMRKRVTG